MSNIASYEISDPDFIEDLRRSQQYVDIAVEWLHSKGYDAIANPVRVRPDVSVMGQYSDNGDITLLFKGEQRVEVKHRPDIAFSGAHDFPYPTVIVDAAHCWDRAAKKPLVYIIFNTDATSCLLVWGKTHKQWTKVRRYDRKKKRWRWFYECPIELCESREICL